MSLPTTDVRFSAVLSDDGRYRYHLSRWWDEGPRVTFVMLNPSKADASVNDPTIVRCMGFAARLGYAGVNVVNLYAFRETKPALLWVAHSLAIDIVGERNDSTLRAASREAYENRAPLIAAWGAGGRPDRVARVLALPGFTRLQCLGVTKQGMPRHPLYLASDTELIPYRGATA